MVFIGEYFMAEKMEHGGVGLNCRMRIICGKILRFWILVLPRAFPCAEKGNCDIILSASFERAGRI